ncbi:MAG: hypothetical protein IKZ54_00015 [Bacteroidales bacterium]|nr:hypothetical protein [Bacteroidales bacterium]
MRNFIYLITSILLIITGFNSCKRVDLVPAYIVITPEDFENCIDVSNFNETHDQNFDQDKLAALTRHKFTHVNVYVNNKNLGCWELPCKVPVLDVSNTDSCTLIMLPAFPMSGMANTISGYPFLNITRQKVLLQKDHVYEVAQNRPKYVYSEYTLFPYFETFSNSTSFSPVPTPDSTQNDLTFMPVAYEDKNVGEIILNDGAGLHFDVQSTPFTVPVGSYRVVLEIRYKTEGKMDISAKMSGAYYPYRWYSVGGINASPNEWKTIHFDLTNTINSNYGSSGNWTDLTLMLTGVGKEGQDTHYYIDDIKVVYIRTA